MLKIYTWRELNKKRKAKKVWEIPEIVVELKSQFMVDKPYRHEIVKQVAEYK
jgi:hypothetical protein